MVTEVAFAVDHVNVEDPPLWIDVGFAVNDAVGIATGGGLVPDTVTVAIDETRSGSSTATSV